MLETSAGQTPAKWPRELGKKASLMRVLEGLPKKITAPSNKCWGQD